ncbi:hypothetical protein CL614_01465 [archaeon]|nr:hypothetical protein [archaeon]|tara:strand:+ start:1771 stop:2172 length:402 start_codon:yes stop_codon:yes gene_type:complete
MRKGITPVISVVLLLLITVAVIGIAFTWFMSTTQDLADDAENSTETIVARFRGDFQIEGMNGNDVYIRNAGNEVLNIESLSVFVTTDKIELSDMEMNPIQPGKTGTLTINRVLVTNDVIEIFGAITSRSIIVE